MFRSTRPTGLCVTPSRNAETLESNLIDMYRSQAQALQRRVDMLENQLARQLAKRILEPPQLAMARCRVQS